MGLFGSITGLFRKEPENLLLELAAELKLTYYPPVDDKPAFATGLYSGRGVTLDCMNEKGYHDIWHPHSRVVVLVDRNVKDTYIVSYQGRFYSRKLGEVKVDDKKFNDKYALLSSAPHKAEKIFTDEVLSWILRLEMPLILSEGHVLFHQDKFIDDKERVKHIIDALVYIATMAERTR
ncbi:MAG: hypothetical protein V1744_00610 [Candidatus Altiarchaeota archaeon]